MFRENWSRTITSARRPAGVNRQELNSQLVAARWTAAKRSRTVSSKAISADHHCAGLISSNQKFSTAEKSCASVMRPDYMRSMLRITMAGIIIGIGRNSAASHIAARKTLQSERGGGDHAVPTLKSQRKQKKSQQESGFRSR